MEQKKQKKNPWSASGIFLKIIFFTKTEKKKKKKNEKKYIFVDERCSPVPYYSNAMASASDSDEGLSTTITCMPQFKFPDGTLSKLLTCQHKHWTPRNIHCICKYCN